MSITTQKVKEIKVGKDEAGLFEYADTKQCIESGETAFTIKAEEAFSGETKTFYFKYKENAEKFS